MSTGRIPKSSVHARSARVGIEERESSRDWGQQLVVRGQLHSPTGQLVKSSCVLLAFRPKEDGASTRRARHSTLCLSSSTWSRSTRGPRHAKRTQFCLPSRVRASVTTHSSASRSEAGVVCYDRISNRGVKHIRETDKKKGDRETRDRQTDTVCLSVPLSVCLPVCLPANELEL